MEKISSLQNWMDQSEKHNTSLHQLMVNWEVFSSGWTEERVKAKMQKNWSIMQSSIENGLNNTEPTMGGLGHQDALKIHQAAKAGIIHNDRLAKICYRALAVTELNATMGCIVAAPTAGACGILPAVLSTVAEERGSKEEEIVEALFIAAGIGFVIAQKASISGAEGGCQAECGSAAAMAAGAVVHITGGTSDQVFQAVALAMKNSLGLVCDPVAGLVEVPCIKRNAFLAVHSLVAVDLALAGVKSVIPPDEVITAMAEIGRDMSSKYKETAQGGLATTPTGLKLKEKIYPNVG